METEFKPFSKLFYISQMSVKHIKKVENKERIKNAENYGGRVMQT